MKERIITGIGIGVVCIPILILSKFIVYPIFLGFLSVIAVWELLRVFGFERRLEVFIPSYAVAGLLPVFAHEMFTKGNQGGYLLVVAATLFGFLLYLAAICVIGKEIIMQRSESQGEEKKQRITSEIICFAIFGVLIAVTVIIAVSRHQKDKFKS